MNTEDHNHKDTSTQPEDASHLSHDLRGLGGRLDALGRDLGDRKGLSSRIYTASVEELPAPVPLELANGGRIRAWGRIALAAAILLAFAVSSRMLLSPGALDSTPESTPRLATGDGDDGIDRDAADPGTIDYDFGIETETDAVLVALIDGGINGQIQTLQSLEGSDDIGAAFAPILGTTGVSFDDYLAEMSIIEVELSR